MRKKFFKIALTVTEILSCPGGFAFAADREAATDKWQYTLFDPTPKSELRGIETDRPNKTDTPHTVDAGHALVETGFFDYIYNHDRYKGANARSESLSFGRFNARIGVLDNLELNVAVDSYDFSWNTDFAVNRTTRLHGFGDTVLGGKLNLWGAESSDENWATALAIQPQMKFATAKRDLGNGHPEFFFGVPFAIDLPDDFHLALQTTVSWERGRDNDRAVTGWQNSASLDRVVFGSFDVYLEYWNRVTSERHQQSEQTFDIGFTVLVAENVVLDTGANFGLTSASDTVEWLAGMSVRF